MSVNWSQSRKSLVLPFTCVKVAISWVFSTLYISVVPPVGWKKITQKGFGGSSLINIIFQERIHDPVTSLYFPAKDPSRLSFVSMDLLLLCCLRHSPGGVKAEVPSKPRLRVNMLMRKTPINIVFVSEAQKQTDKLLKLLHSSYTIGNTIGIHWNYCCKFSQSVRHQDNPL